MALRRSQIRLRRRSRSCSTPRPTRGPVPPRWRWPGRDRRANPCGFRSGGGPPARRPPTRAACGLRCTSARLATRSTTRAPPRPSGPGTPTVHPWPLRPGPSSPMSLPAQEKAGRFQCAQPRAPVWPGVPAPRTGGSGRRGARPARCRSRPGQGPPRRAAARRDAAGRGAASLRAATHRAAPPVAGGTARWRPAQAARRCRSAPAWCIPGPPGARAPAGEGGGRLPPGPRRGVDGRGRAAPTQSRRPPSKPVQFGIGPEPRQETLHASEDPPEVSVGLPGAGHPTGRGTPPAWSSRRTASGPRGTLPSTMLRTVCCAQSNYA